MNMNIFFTLVTIILKSADWHIWYLKGQICSRFHSSPWWIGTHCTATEDKVKSGESGSTFLSFVALWTCIENFHWHLSQQAGWSNSLLLQLLEATVIKADMMKHYNQVIIVLTQFQEKKSIKGQGRTRSSHSSQSGSKLLCRQGVPTQTNLKHALCADKESPPQPIRKQAPCADRSPYPSQSQLNRQDLN